MELSKSNKKFTLRKLSSQDNDSDSEDLSSSKNTSKLADDDLVTTNHDDESYKTQSDDELRDPPSEALPEYSALDSKTGNCNLSDFLNGLS